MTVLPRLTGLLLIVLASGCCHDLVYHCGNSCGPCGISGRLSDDELETLCGCQAGGCSPHGCAAPACGTAGWHQYTITARAKDVIGCHCDGCGEVYWDEWKCDPPAACDPCDHCGNWTGPQCCPPKCFGKWWKWKGHGSGHGCSSGCCNFQPEGSYVMEPGYAQARRPAAAPQVAAVPHSQPSRVASRQNSPRPATYRPIPAPTVAPAQQRPPRVLQGQRTPLRTKPVDDSTTDQDSPTNAGERANE